MHDRHAAAHRRANALPCCARELLSLPIAFACVCVATLPVMAMGQPSGEGASVIHNSIVVSLRAASGDVWVSAAPGGAMQLHVPAPPDAGGNWSADLEAQLWRAQQDLDTVGVAVFLDAVMVGSCVPPCAVLLKGVTQGDHMVRAAPATSASHNVSASHLLRFRLSRLHAQASSHAVAVDAAAEAVESGTDPEVQQLQDSEPAVPSTRGGDPTAELPPADPLEDGRYVSILYPTDDTCFTERSVDYYVSAAVTDGFFRLPHAHNIIARFEATVHCITTPEDMKASWGGVIMPAPMSYDPKTHGALMKCHWYESEFTLKDGWVRREDGQLAINGQHDCPRGTVCKHDLEDGFMIDIGLVVKEECCAISVRISFIFPSPCSHPKLAFTAPPPRPSFLLARFLVSSFALFSRPCPRLVYPVPTMQRLIHLDAATRAYILWEAQAGETLHDNLAEGMHAARFFLVDGATKQQLGQEASVTFFVDHGAGRVCPGALEAGAMRAAPRRGDGETRSVDAQLGQDAEHPQEQSQRRQQQDQEGASGQTRRELVNVARQGVATQSSTDSDLHALFAIDGCLEVGSGDGAHRGQGRPSRTGVEALPFWEVILWRVTS